MTIVLAATLVAGGVGASVAPAAEAASESRPQARGDQPPFRYADCFRVAKKRGETPAHAKWHCDELVKKGWVRPPQTKRPQSKQTQSKQTQAKPVQSKTSKADHKLKHPKAKAPKN
ncbi:hypothetical protein CK936_32435 [Streptomyces albireticuli]|uniref:Uncharacterized protein n=2 Tax=Streptomyces albireticuli TaxID=1940 RepID=A0A2A2CXG9_9ACTN|nr:hypothetical protein CK936_32435 [Streptomyces albireticuli]